MYKNNAKTDQSVQAYREEKFGKTTEEMA